MDNLETAVAIICSGRREERGSIKRNIEGISSCLLGKLRHLVGFYDL